RSSLVGHEQALHLPSGADRFEHRVWSGDRLPRLVRRRGLRARTRGDAADLLRVLRAGARPGSTHARHRRTAGARSTERAAAVAGAGADAAAWPERAAARRTRRGTRARDPA